MRGGGWSNHVLAVQYLWGYFDCLNGSFPPGANKHAPLHFQHLIQSCGCQETPTVPAALGQEAEKEHDELRTDEMRTDEMFPTLDLSHDFLPLMHCSSLSPQRSSTNCNPPSLLCFCSQRQIPFFISWSLFLRWILHSTAQNTGAEGKQEEHLVLHSHLVVDNKIANEKSALSTPCICWTMNKLCRHRLNCYKRPSVKNKMMTFTGIKHLESHHFMSNGP